MKPWDQMTLEERRAHNAAMEETRTASKALVADLSSQAGPYCNFCGMDKEHAGHLVEGPNNVHICWQCADSALEVIKYINAKQK